MNTVTRRGFLASSAALASTLALPKPALADERGSLAATPPPGFTPFAAPGKIIKVTKANSLQENGLWPRADAARQMLERAMTELTGESDMTKAFGRFVHKDDKVAIKVNGIGGDKGTGMGTNQELVIPIVEQVLALGVPAANVWVYEQYFLLGARITDKILPGGVRAYNHRNGMATMEEIQVEGVGTKFTKYLTDATAFINVSLMKDHSNCGFTGMLKNATHGSCINPHYFHGHNSSTQIAHLYAQDVIKSRARLCITDAYKVMYEGGPKDARPDCRPQHEAVYVSSDPVALDAFGAALVDKIRLEKGLRSLKDAKRDPAYIRVAAELGLGVADLNRIRMREVAL